MTASKENVTIEEDMDTSEMNDSKQWNITDQQVKLKDRTAIKVCVCVCVFGLGGLGKIFSLPTSSKKT